MKRIVIKAPNVWGDRIKFSQFDVVEVADDVADILVKNKQAKITKDDLTHEIIMENDKPVLVAND